MVMQTDTATTFNSNSAMNLVGYDMTRRAAERAFSDCGLSPSDIQLIELHDCFSANELITYEALGLCPPGGAGELVDSGATTYGGRWVVNPSGGLISKGHPLGATGLAQCAELCWQLRGEAGTRQVPAARHGLQHNLGLGGAVVVAVYRGGGGGGARRVPVMVSVSGSSIPEEDNFKSAVVFRDIAKRLELEGETLVQKMSSVFEFRVRGGTGDEIGVWTVDVKTGKGSVNYASGLPADVSLSVSDDDLVSVMSGKLNPQT
ncbi:sterol carrier protein 2, partial [Lampetra fluviatilis]